MSTRPAAAVRIRLQRPGTQTLAARAIDRAPRSDVIASLPPARAARRTPGRPLARRETHDVVHAPVREKHHHIAELRCAHEDFQSIRAHGPADEARHAACARSAPKRRSNSVDQIAAVDRMVDDEDGNLDRLVSIGEFCSDGALVRGRANLKGRPARSHDALEVHAHFTPRRCRWRLADI